MNFEESCDFSFFLLCPYRDEDMQSLASLMSIKQSDIGNLDDFNDSDEEVGEDRRVSAGTGLVTAVTGKSDRKIYSSFLVVIKSPCCHGAKQTF